MRIIATRNHNEVGTDRVDRDGKISVIKDEDVEVTLEERMEWANKATIDDERELETEENDAGNSMARNEKMRTSVQRPGEYSIERRLVEERDPGSSTDIVSEATLQQAMGRAFCMVAPIVMAGSSVPTKKVASISAMTGVDVVDVLRLEKIAEQNIDLSLAAMKRLASGEIPGVVEEDGGQIVKESEPGVSCSRCKKTPIDRLGDEMAEEELGKVGVETGLCE